VLVLDGRGDAFLAGGIALALGVDNATARQLALARFPRVALRGEDPVALESRAGKVRETLGVAARVVARAALAEVAPPRAVLAWAPGGALELTADAAWLGDPGQEFPARWGAHLHGVELAVAGEIVLRRFRAGPDGGRGRGREVKVAAERRIGVLDLHGPRVFLRVTEGISRLDALPGGEPGSARRSFKALEDGLPAQVPGVRLTPARVCAPGDPPALGVVEASPDGVELSGWPEWEEHTRLVRALHGIGPERD
jgi:hypothetical protein